MSINGIDQAIVKLQQLRDLEARHGEEEEQIGTERQREDQATERHRDEEDKARSAARDANKKALARLSDMLTEAFEWFERPAQAPDPIVMEPNLQQDSRRRGFQTDEPRMGPPAALRSTAYGNAHIEISNQLLRTDRECSRDRVQLSDTVVELNGEYYILNKCPICKKDSAKFNGNDPIRSFQLHVQRAHPETQNRWSANFESTVSLCGIKITVTSKTWADERQEALERQNKFRATRDRESAEDSDSEEGDGRGDSKKAGHFEDERRDNEDETYHPGSSLSTIGTSQQSETVVRKRKRDARDSSTTSAGAYSQSSFSIPSSLEQPTSTGTTTGGRRSESVSPQASGPSKPKPSRKSFSGFELQKSHINRGTSTALPKCAPAQTSTSFQPFKPNNQHKKPAGRAMRNESQKPSKRDLMQTDAFGMYEDQATGALRKASLQEDEI